jgi:F-type H+-transporting ATPase subunit delta
MAELTTVARPYAKAAFQLAQNEAKLAEWSTMLALAAQVIADSEFAAYVARPTLSAKDQADALLLVVADQFNEQGQNFIRQLAGNKRLAALPAISELFDALRAHAEGAVDVAVTAAFAMSEKQQAAMARVLTEKLSRRVNLTSTVDASLIGGAVIHAGDLVIDASVRGKLGKLRATLNT